MSHGIAARNRAIAEEFYRRSIAGDQDGARALLSPERRLTQSPDHPVPGSWVGEAAFEAEGRVFGALGITGFTVEQLLVGEDGRVASLCEVEGTDADGQPWRMPVLEVLRIEDGRVADVQPFYWDVAELRRVAATRGVVPPESGA